MQLSRNLVLNNRFKNVSRVQNRFLSRTCPAVQLVWEVMSAICSEALRVDMCYAVDSSDRMAALSDDASASHCI